jgi:hypothetical protein
MLFPKSFRGLSESHWGHINPFRNNKKLQGLYTLQGENEKVLKICQEF